MEHSTDLSHDKVNRFLRKGQFTSGQLWDLVKEHLCDSADYVIIADDSVQGKRYSKFIELVKSNILAMKTAQYARLTWSILSILPPLKAIA